MLPGWRPDGLHPSRRRSERLLSGMQSLSPLLWRRLQPESGVCDAPGGPAEHHRWRLLRLESGARDAPDRFAEPHAWNLGGVLCLCFALVRSGHRGTIG